jgi:Histidine kinase
MFVSAVSLGMFLLGSVFADGLVRSHAGENEVPVAVVRQWRHPSEGNLLSLRRWFADLPAGLQYSEVRFKAGDDIRWVEPGWDDAAWDIIDFQDLLARRGVEWIRFRVRLGADGKETLPAGIMISTTRSYELFWDGVQLGANGVPGMNREAEQVGRVDQWFSIPGALRGPGEHLVAIRTSSYRVGFPSKTSGLRFLVDESAVLQGKVLREAFVPTLASGALCMVGLASVIMWLVAARRTPLLLLAGVCLSGAAMQGMQAVRWFFHYPADWHYPVLTLMVTLVGVQGVLMVAFLVTHFQVPRYRWILAGLVPVLGVISWLSPERMNLEGMRILATGIIVSLACAIWALWRRRRGACPVVVGVTASALLLLAETDDFRVKFFLNFLPALIGLITSLALQLQDERRHAREAKLTAARMEIELLKKNLQPHFLLNTLTAVSEVIEQDPAGAVKFIDDLAAVFRSLALMSGERLVSLQRELELCRLHLRVVGRRTGRQIALQAEGIDETTLVPPALFLTLIENGLVHQQADDGAAFRISRGSPADGMQFSFLSPGRTRELDGRSVGGTGLRYVKARLEESFPGQWTLAQGAVEGGWGTRIGWRVELNRSGAT